MGTDHINDIQKKLDYEFKDTKRLRMALTHRSFVAERKKEDLGDNQRLEWLGDSVLGLVVSECLYDQLPECDEGLLSKLKSQLVSKHALSRLAKSIGIGGFLYLGKGEEEAGGRHRDSILADAVESLLGALYLDGGLKLARRVILKYHKKEMERIISTKPMRDYKSLLQEHLQKKGFAAPVYDLFTQTGPDHKKTFTVRVEVEGSPFHGTGSSKKEAEQMAAWVALDELHCENST